MSVDNVLRNLLFTKFRIGRIQFEFLEGLLAVCITGVGFLLRTPFETGLPHWPYLLVEWYLAVAASALVWRMTKSRMRTLGAYSILLILPTVIADGTILRGDACVGALLFLCALLLLENGKIWFFTIAAAALLLLDVKYVGILFACMVLWQREWLKSGQLFLLLAAGAARFVHAYRAWLSAGYTLVTFHWPNIYGIVGKEAVQGQLIDPIALVGLFLALGLLVLAVWLFGQAPGSEEARTEAIEVSAARRQSICVDGARVVRLCLFFVLAAGYFLPYMDQSCGYLPCVLSVICFLLAPREFLVPMALQIVTFAGYQECFHGESMMPMAVFSVIHLLAVAYLGIKLLTEAGVISLCSRKN